MRTTPLEQWKEQAVKFDSMIRTAIERMLADPMSDETYAQACLTPHLLLQQFLPMKMAKTRFSGLETFESP